MAISPYRVLVIVDMVHQSQKGCKIVVEEKRADISKSCFAAQYISAVTDMNATHSEGKPL
ncbi:MAG: hypothetical protein AB4080_24475 [Trichodesmium sp.]